MTRREKLEEQYEDALFALLMDDLAADLGNRGRAENRELNDDPETAVPEGAKRRCLKAIKRRFALQTAGDAVSVSGRLFSKAAVICLVAALLLTTVFAAYRPFRQSVLTAVTETFGDHIEFRVDRPWMLSGQTVEPAWLPEGYALRSREDEANAVRLVYADPEGNEIAILVSDISSAVINVDTEDAEVAFKAVQGNSALTVQKNRIDGRGDPHVESAVAWLDPDRSVFIHISSLSEALDTLLEIADQLSLG